MQFEVNHPHHHRLRPLYLGVLAALATSGVASAEPTLKAVEVNDSRDAATLNLEQPSPTGSRTGLNIKDTPASVESIDQQTILERGDYQVKEAISRATGVTAVGSGGNGGMSFSTRGFTGPNSIGIAEDGVRLQTASGTQNFPGDSWGYERIEILHGPASVVYGSGTVGATINAIRKAPSKTSQIETLFGVGNDGVARVGAGATGSINEITTFRVDAYGTRSDGSRDLGDAKSGKFMSTLRIQPNSDVRFELIADTSRQEPERYWGTPIANGKIVSSLRDENYNTDNSLIRYEDQRLRARAEWQANDWLKLSNELYRFTADREWRNVESYALNAKTWQVRRSSYVNIEHDMDQTGNRLEAGLQGAGHKAVFGWEYARIDFTHSNNSPYSGASTVSAIDPLHGTWSSPDPTRAAFDTHTTMNALYVEDAWQLADRWTVLAGARHDVADVKKTDLLGTGSGLTTTLSGSSYRLGTTFKATADTNLYVQASTGSDPVNGIVTVNLANKDFKLTSGRQVEAGVKQSFAGGLGEWTAAVYRIEKDDIITTDPLTPSLSIQGGSQYSQGIELAAALSPWKNWRFEANYAALKARYDEFSEKVGSVSVSRAGNIPVNVPEQVANLWAHYRLGDWQASLGGRYVGERYANSANTIELPSYVVADASLAWQYDRRTTFRLLGRNLADKVYATTSSGSTQFVLGEERRVELVAELKF